MEPTDVDLLVPLAGLRLQRGDRRGARRVLDAWAAAHPRDPRNPAVRVLLDGGPLGLRPNER